MHVNDVNAGNSLVHGQEAVTLSESPVTFTGIRSNVELSRASLAHLKYRPDIDGLRAIAVLSVVGFHAAPGRISGGFVGVDIFFVISGFLISTIILKGLENNNFSFFEFYSRRIKRIFPALLVVLLASYSIGWFLLVAEEYKQLGKHIAGGAGFISNFALWNENGYFDNAAETKPLLHLWSLGIEEQFYIVWPLLLTVLWKRRLNILTITLVIILISFGLNIYKTNSDAVGAFYSPQTRIWEISAGSALAYLTLYKKHLFANRSFALINTQSFVGATLIAIGILVVTNKYPFPGWWALLPTAGTALIIAAGTHAWLNRVVLSNRVLVWFGLISFPLYLWHWPLLSFLRILQGELVTQEKRFFAVLISLALAWLTYKVIEKPIRFGKHGKLPTIILFVSMTATGCIGYNSYMQDGFNRRAGIQPKIVNAGDVGHSQFFEYLDKKFHLCTPKSIRDEAYLWNEYKRCFQSEIGKPKQIAIIGDSHGEALFAGLAEELAGTNVVIYSKTGLPFISNEKFRHIFEYVISDSDIKTILIAGNWGAKIDKDSRHYLESELLQTVNLLIAANKHVYIVDDVPEFSFDPNICKYIGRLWIDNKCVQGSEIFHLQFDNYYPALKSVADTNTKLKLIRTSDVFCDEKFCSMARNGILFYRDNHHLNINGSRQLGRYIVENNPMLRVSDAARE